MDGISLIREVLFGLICFALIWQIQLRDGILSWLMKKKVLLTGCPNDSHDFLV